MRAAGTAPAAARVLAEEDAPAGAIEEDAPGGANEEDAPDGANEEDAPEGAKGKNTGIAVSATARKTPDTSSPVRAKSASP